MIKSVLRRIAAAFVAAAGLALPAPGGRGRRPLRRCGASRTPTPPSICSGPSTCCPRNISWRTAKFDQAVAGSNELVRRDHRRRQGSDEAGRDPDQARLLQQRPADRHARPARPRSRRSRRRSPRAAFRARRSTRWKPGPRPSCCSATSSRTSASRATRVSKRTLRTSFTSAGKPIGELETNAEQLGFFDTLPESAQRALARRRDRGSRKHAQRVPVDARRLVARRRPRDRPQLQPRTCPPRPSSRRRCSIAATPIGAAGSSSAWRSPGRC